VARGTFLSRFRRQPPGSEPEAQPELAADAAAEGSSAEPDQAPASVRTRPLAHPGALRRERRVLVSTREERIRDLGGLILEMFRRDRFREDLMREQAEEIFGVEARIQEIDGMLLPTRGQVQAARCVCGAPIYWGSHFCPNCGRPTGEAVVSCTNCGHPLPADARFCGNCGAQAPAPAETSGNGAQQTAGEKSPGSEAKADPWES
jgi:hypothetical protein